MIYLNCVFLVFLQMLFFCCQNEENSSFEIERFELDICIDGINSFDEWNKVKPIKGISSPWDNSIIDDTTIKLFHTDTFFYFLFEVTDTTFITFEFQKEASVAKGDRVEIFLSNNTALNKYYCIEIDPNGNILDYRARFYREFDDSWDFETVEIGTSITPKGYVVEGRIRKKELRYLGLCETFYLGIYRADFKSKNFEDVTWYSWVKPKSKTPDFHIPSSFLKVRFGQI